MQGHGQKSEQKHRTQNFAELHDHLPLLTMIKYSRIGPLTIVPLEKEPTENIKAHFGTRMECDLLAGERGPTYTDAAQIKNWKLIHIRFIENVNTGMDRSSVIRPDRSVRVASSFPASPQKAKQLEISRTIHFFAHRFFQIIKLYFIVDVLYFKVM